MSIESTCKKYLEEFKKINDFHFKFGVVLLDAFMAVSYTHLTLPTTPYV